MGFADPIGQKITVNTTTPRQGEIIGVINDFQNEDIHTHVGPVIFGLAQKREDIHNFLVRYQEGKLNEAFTHLKSVFEKYHPGIPLQYSLLDTDYATQLYTEVFIGNLSFYFTIIAITIACLGLFGLTMYNAQRRTREIAIRKVLGASVRQIVTMLFGDFVRPVVLSFLIALPLANYLMLKFLEDYALRVNISPYFFAFVIAIIAGVVAVAVSYQSFTAAVKNSVDSLKVD
jgi:putative ABC transport system permease protein